jgi:integrase
MTRRDYGSGGLRQRPDGYWEGRVELGRDERGQRVRRTFTRRTKKAVQKEIADALRDRDAGLQVAGGRLSVAEFLARWMDEAARHRLRPRTFVGYRVIVNRHLVPSLGRTPLPKLTAVQVQGMLNRLTAEGASPQTVRNVHAVLRRALNQGMRWGLVARNVASLVDLPAQRSYDVPALDADAARAVLAAVAGDRLEPLVTVTLATGLRQGEALGLRWSDLDPEAGTLTVRHALQRNAGRVELVEPKTRRSRRTIALPRFAVAALLRQRDWFQAQDRRLADSAWQEGGYVFTTRIGTPMHGGDVTRALQRLLAAAGLPRMRFHDLRHGAASLLLAQGIHPRVVMETLGHSTIAVTMNVYSHVAPALQRAAADSLEAALG